jgi:hypothetical protein
MADLALEKELTDHSIAAALAVATVKLVQSGQEVIARAQGSDEADATVLLNTIVAASLDAAAKGNSVASNVLTALHAFVEQITILEADAKVEAVVAIK